MGFLQSPNGPLGALRPGFALVASLVVFGLAVGLSAVPEFVGRDGRLEQYERALREMQGELVELRGQQSQWEMAVEGRLTEFNNRFEVPPPVSAEIPGVVAQQAALTREFDALKVEFEERMAAATATLNEQPAPAPVEAVSPLSPVAERRRIRKEVLEPVFQLTGRDAVGSAVLLHLDEKPGQRFYLAVTCYHVVRDILEERGKVADPYAERFDAVFDRDGHQTTVKAHMVAFDESLDLALVRVPTEIDLGQLATMAPASREREVEIFTPVYTVGCPLGTVAQMTRGEVTHRNWEVDSRQFWMVSSPAYFGNSGGGVFLQDTNEFVGVFAKIYTHGSFRPQVITHMGLVIPLSVVQGWLKTAGYAHLVPTE